MTIGLAQEPEVPGSIFGPAFISPSADSRKAVVSFWQKYVHKVLVNHLGGLSLPRKSVVRLTDHPNMILVFTMDVKQHMTALYNMLTKQTDTAGYFLKL